MTSTTTARVVPFPADAESGAPIDLGPAVAARIEHWCRIYDLPLGTFRMLRAKSLGPRCFTIGKLIFCTRDEWVAWIEKLSEEGGTGPLSTSVRRKREAAPR